MQDLEKQLAQAKATIQSLRNNGKEMNHENGESSHEVPLHFPEMGSSPQRRLPPPLSQNLTGVRAHLRNYCRGVFKPPPPYRLVGRQPHFTPPPTNLPDQTIADHILSQYYATVHSVIPILHWPQFLARYRELYRRGDLSAEAPSWAALLYSVLACGMLYVVDPKIKAIYNDSGRQFIEYSRQLTDLFNDEFTIDHARAALLTSVYMAELNCKSAAWTWLGSTVRIAQDIGLHRESGPWPIVEGEMRRRVWWGIYVWDR